MIMKQQGFDFKSGGSRQKLNGPVTDNPCRSHGFGLLNPDTMIPYQKNPVLSAFFREIDRADELGSGMRKMMLYGKKYGGADPQLIEGDSFRMIISVPEFGANPAKTSRILPTEKMVAKAHDEAHDEAHDAAHDEAHDLSATEHAILEACRNTALAPSEILQILGYKRRTGNYKKAVHRLTNELKLLEMTMPEAIQSKKQQYRLTAKGKKLLAGRISEVKSNTRNRSDS